MEDKTVQENLSSGPAVQSEEDYLAAQANLADNIEDAVVMVDQRERVIYANPRARDLLKIKRLGRPPPLPIMSKTRQIAIFASWHHPLL